MNEFKLNNRRTILVGLAFLSICAFWQMYDSVIPLILRETFGMDESLTGIIMAADNILALFLLPFFGGLSDKTHTKLGRRTPYILAGTAGAVILMNLLPVLDNSYSRQAAPFKLAAFVIVLGLLLISMGTYRSPAVALMPDVTAKPLRSKANAIINLMGAVGGVLYLGVAAVLYPTSKVADLAHVDYRPLFLVVSAVMVIAVAILLLTIREPALAAENQELERSHPEWNLAEDDGSGTETLPPAVKRSLAFLLASIALWYIGYNGVTTWFTTYISQVMGEGLGGASTCLLVATAGHCLLYSYRYRRIPGRTEEDHYGRCDPAGILLYRGFSFDYVIFFNQCRHVYRIRPGGTGLGGDQREFPAHGGGDVPRQRCRKIYRLLLYSFHAGPGRHPDAGRFPDENRQLPDPVPLCGLFRDSQLRDHVLCPPWGQ